AESETPLPYAALADLLAPVSDEGLDRLPPQQRAAVAAAVARATGPVDQHALSRAVVELLSDGAQLVAIDDVQWLGAPRAAALTFALRRLGSSSLRLLLSVRGRPDSVLGLESWERPPQRLEVGPLAPTELGALLREALGVDLPRPRVELLARAS